jgi:acyl phosphate:glycerol-3-phosphate acyltransferase
MSVTPVAGVLLGALALVAGYLVGSLPAAARIGRLAGVEPAAGVPGGNPAAVWRSAGPGWGFLALTANLAKGVVPVAVGVVTFSWAVGWAAGIGAVLGAGWPAFGRRAGDWGLATFAGAAFTLAPPAGLLGGLLGLAVLGVGRVAGRDARVAAIATGIASFLVVGFLVGPDVARPAALVALTVVALVRLVTIREP